MTKLVDRYEILNDDYIIVQFEGSKPTMHKIFHENEQGVLCNDLESYVSFDHATATIFE